MRSLAKPKSFPFICSPEDLLIQFSLILDIVSLSELIEDPVLIGFILHLTVINTKHSIVVLKKDNNTARSII